MRQPGRRPRVGGRYGAESHSGGGSQAGGHASDSPGVGSGNHVQVPVDVPVNVCGNSVNVGGIGNAVTGNDCAERDGRRSRADAPRPATDPRQPTPGKPGSRGTRVSPALRAPGQPGTPGHPGHPATPAGRAEPDLDRLRARRTTRARSPSPSPRVSSSSPQTGSELPLGAILPAGAGALLGGAVLYRRARSAA